MVGTLIGTPNREPHDRSMMGLGLSGSLSASLGFEVSGFRIQVGVWQILGP